MKLGRYEVVRELGKGAMGIVYLAKDPLIGRLVALKTIRPAAHVDDDETKEFQQRFVREAQAAGILNHPAIVTVHDIGQDEPSGMSFIAMEYVEGQNLKEVLAQGRALSFEQIGDLVAQVAEGLDFAHAKGIVHRDVKPANIILLDGNRAKITDFGIAKITSGGNLTTTGQFLGTPNYMAPEQIKGAPVDGRTDIFSLGICLYECLTRRKPFGGDSLTSISYKIVHEPFPPLHEVNPQIPEGFNDVVAHSLAKDPAKRYQRAKDMAMALRAVGRGERPVRPSEPIFAEETIVTRDRDKIPTLEIPFPEAEVEAAPPVMPAQEVGGSTRPLRAAAGAIAAASAPAKAAKPPKPPKPPKAPKAPTTPVSLQLKQTLSNLRTTPLWRRRISPAIFFAIVAVLVAILIGAVATIRARNPVVPAVDTQLEAKRARERQLRKEGNELLRQGRVADAYVKYQELKQLSPHSPYVNELLQRLMAMRQQEELSKQQLAQAQAKLEQGLALYNEKKYAEAIPVLQEALVINPQLLQADETIKASQAELQKAADRQAARRGTTPGTRGMLPETSTTATMAETTQTVPAPAAGPSQLHLTFNSPFADGTIIVKFGADLVARENLYEDRGRAIFRRRAARAVNVTKEVTPKNADVQIWINVPSQKINEYHLIANARLMPGTNHHLAVSYNAQSKTFDYALN
ncbi:MAG TPA: protein kinase [Thermoanaerobaculia bacterium]|nr:protein kinase [Thermoanaerobaculia bacterium]